MARVKILRILALMALPLAVSIAGAQMDPEIDWGRAGSHQRSVLLARRSLEAALDYRQELLAQARSSAANNAIRRGPVSVVVADARHKHLLRPWLEAAERELGTMPGRLAAATPITVVLSSRAYEVKGRRRFPTTLDNSCTVVSVPEAPPSTESLNTSQFPVVLGQCAIVAAYGPAGAGIQRWAASVGTGERPFLTGTRSGPFIDAYRWWYWAEIHDSRVEVSNHPGEVRGNENLGWGDLDIAACQAGEGSNCRLIISNRFSSGLRGDFVWWLIKRDTARFAQFWRSDADLADALLQSFGQPMGSLAAEWARDRFPVVNAGPSFRGGMVRDLLIVLVLGLPLSLLAGRRRTVA